MTKIPTNPIKKIFIDYLKILVGFSISILRVPDGDCSGDASWALNLISKF